MIDPLDKLKNYFYAERIHNEVRDSMRKDLETMPLVLHQEEYINSYTTQKMLTFSNMLAHAKALKTKKKRRNYIKTLFLRGYKIIKKRREF